MSLHGLSLIAGQSGKAGGATFHAVNPTTSTGLAPAFHEASMVEVENALDVSAEAFTDYGTSPPAVREAFLEAIATEIEALGDTLLQRAHVETGLPPVRLTAERARTCAQLRLFSRVAGEGSWVDARIDTAQPERKPLPRPDLRRRLLPLGPVVVFGSSNFPLAFSVAGGDTASAFAAGCTVVVKAHRAHPGTAELVGGAINRAASSCHLPPGVFSLIHGGGTSVGIALVKHPSTKAVGFTGSHTAGRALFDTASKRPQPIPVFAEMSSLNPMFLLPGALRERAAEIAQGLLGSISAGVGQFCTKPGLVFALRGPSTDAFLQLLAAGVQASPAGTMLTHGIRYAFEANRGVISDRANVRPLAIATATPLPNRTEARLSVAQTTAVQFLITPELATEAFGPFTLVVLAEHEHEFIDCARMLNGQLTATLHANSADLAAARPLFAELERKAGRIVINGYPTGVEVCPAMNHGGPYPATTDVRYTSVGTAAMLRFARPVCYQDLPDDMLPPELRKANPLGILRLVNGSHTRDPL